MLRKLLLLSLISVSFFSFANSITETKNTIEKKLIITVDESGSISVNGDIVSSDNLARYIQERLFKSFMGTGRMHSKIKLTKTSNKVPELVMNVVLKEIKEGQKKALTELCVQKYNNRFEDITERQQKKLKKRFPVLFQTTFK